LAEDDRPPGPAPSTDEVKVAEPTPPGSEEAAPEGVPPVEPGGPIQGLIPETGRWSFRRSLLVPMLAIVTALSIGAIIIIFSNSEALAAWSSFFSDPLAAFRSSGRAVADAYRALFTGALGNPRLISDAIRGGDLHQVALTFYPLSETVVTATPLIFAGLSVALGFRAGLFNIGAEGQITMGALVGALAGFSFAGLPDPVHLALIVVAGFAGGAAWGAIPGILKAKTGAHEVITTIMLNFVALQLVDYALSKQFFRPAGTTNPISKPVTAAFPHLFGSSLRMNAGILLALAMAFAVAWLLSRTTLGFEFRAVGANAPAARAAGMSPTRTYVLVMALAGGLAGLAAATQLASVSPSLERGFSSGIGFDAIALALLGRATPGGVVAASFLFAVLRVGARSMQAATDIPVDLITVIQALVIVFVAAPALVRAIYRIRARRVIGQEVFTKGWSG
jgi:general nucleoside transport system permease protein